MRELDLQAVQAAVAGGSALAAGGDGWGMLGKPLAEYALA